MISATLIAAMISGLLLQTGAPKGKDPSSTVLYKRSQKPESTEKEQSKPEMAIFEFKIDKMTDRPVCLVTTPLHGGMQARVSKSDQIMFVVPNGRVDWYLRGMVRIGDAPPLRLAYASSSVVAPVPTDMNEGIIRALYREEKVLVRWYEHLSGERTEAVETLGFREAYDQAVERCLWPSLQKSVPKSQDSIRRP